MTNDIETPLALIAAILEKHKSLLQSASPVERSSPAFDPRFLQNSQELDRLQPNVTQRVSSWDLPDHVSTELAAFLSEELSKYQEFVKLTRSEILAQLIKTTLANDPTSIPFLVESTCDVICQSAISRMLSAVQEQVGSFKLGDSDTELEDDSASESDSADDGDNMDDIDDDALDEPEGEDDSPMKPGEEIPPLETKYLPIFEALHERGKVLTKPEKTYLVNMTGMTYRQITIWNRRRGELKENNNATVSYSKASSSHSDESSEFSEHELENNLGPYPSNTIFDIRSWRLQSALATKDDGRATILPPSPFKNNFPPALDVSDTESDDSELSIDTDDEIAVPPGLHTQSPAAPTAAADPASTTRISVNAPVPQTQLATNAAAFSSKKATNIRPIKSLPSSRRSALSSALQPTGDQHSQSLSPKTSNLQYQSNHASDVAHSLSQFVSSSESGLIIHVEATPQLQTSTLRSSIIHTPLVPVNGTVSVPSDISPSSTSTSARSPQRQSSPTSSISPRPNIKPLPRRTGCAPRPRPPPRSGPLVSEPSLVTVPSSSRPSVVLPPSSNPSLGNTTLGALLRPNSTAPAIPQDIEERLTAMAGRMGVGSSTRKGISSSTPQVSGTLGSSAFPNRNALFSFGPTSLPGAGVSSDRDSAIKQAAKNSTSLPPS